MKNKSQTLRQYCVILKRAPRCFYGVKIQSQASHSTSQENPKHQIPIFNWELGIGNWNLLGMWLLGFGIFITPFQLHAQELSYQFQEQIFRVMPLKEWRDTEGVLMYKGHEVRFTDVIPSGVTKKEKMYWNTDKIEKSLQSEIADVLNRKTGGVVITRDTEGNIVFDGLALPGREVNIPLASLLTVQALEEGISIIQLPVTETAPEVIVDDPALKRMGIKELVIVGESDYTGSPLNRKHNIAIGLSKFNGALIGKGEEFSFNKLLGPVNGTTGYLEELTILGEKTLPAYGGGLCQVSTTAYRGVWKAGFPISARKNHSYAVRYYSPPGTDATIYPPWTDMRFVNDSDGSLLIQTHYEDNKAYFLYYGTKPTNRSVELVGPFNWDYKNPPEDRFGYTSDIPVGTRRIVSKQVPGMKNVWYRYITDSQGETLQEEFYSVYEARPYYEEIGIASTEPHNILPMENHSPQNILLIEEQKPRITPIAIPRRGERVRERRS
jgi:vancomycin resistance protein YoaR